MSQVPFRDRPYRRTAIALAIAVGAHVAVIGAGAWLFRDYVAAWARSTDPTQARLTARSLQRAIDDSPVIVPSFAMQGVASTEGYDLAFRSDAWDRYTFDPQLSSWHVWQPDPRLRSAIVVPDVARKKTPSAD
jgi:hypothetical protein